ncbi:MAG: nicotinate-nucleotide adenylyltransferase, partial [Bacteroidales bacterium]|nr:nicotinate-nucleotide adenylyltransferase [Bacteroidales bacterium]
MSKIGIYSGSFNPVHKGHVSLCSYLVKQGIVDRVWLIRSPLNPFKVDTASTLAPDDDREAM